MVTRNAGVANERSVETYLTTSALLASTRVDGAIQQDKQSWTAGPSKVELDKLVRKSLPVEGQSADATVSKDTLLPKRSGIYG